MTLNLSVPEQKDLKPRITVFGVGGAGGNAIDNMIEKELEGVDFVAANTDAQALQASRAKTCVQIGIKLTQGLGAGADATIGKGAAEESIEQIVDQLNGVHMCFITAGMGGGTGTGAAPIIAQAARELGVLTVGVVTKPFQFEGSRRMQQAEDGVAALQKVVDTLIIIPNQNLFRLANENTTFTEAFSMADDVLYQGVKGVTDLMVRPGLINLDFSDVRSVINEMGKAMMGTGEASGEDRAVQAAEKAIANPLLDDISLQGATGVLINITGGYDLTLFELDEAASRIRKEVEDNAHIIVGSTLDPSLEGTMRVSVVATGIEAKNDARARSDQAHSDHGSGTDGFESGDVHREEHPFEQTENIFREEDYAQETTAVAHEPRTSFFDTEPHQEVEQPIQDYAVSQDVAGDYHPHVEAPQESEAVGGPSPEVLARLRAAVSKEPGEDELAHNRPRVVATRPHEEAQPGAGRLNSLIGRVTNPTSMAGQPAHGEHPAPVEADTATREEKRRIEIPAFLRRQAN